MAVVGVLVWFAFLRDTAQAPTAIDLAPIEQTTQEPAVTEVPRYDKQRIQSTLDTWIAQAPTAQYSVVIQDPLTGERIATVNEHQTYFAASLYKLYFAFLAWQDVQSGQLAIKQDFYRGQSTTECLDKMIRESDSPCGEALLQVYDYSKAQERLQQLGLLDINAPAFEVSAADMAVLLQHIFDEQLLNTTNAQTLRESMREQIYDKGLKTGFSGWSVEDKVGFSENGDWHDVGFVQTSSGSWLIVSVLSRNAYAAGVSGLAKELQQAM